MINNTLSYNNNLSITTVDCNTIDNFDNDNTILNVTKFNISGCQNDDQIIQMWLNRKSKLTAKRYRSTIVKFFSFVNKPIQEIKPYDLDLFASQLVNQKTGLPLAMNTLQTTIATVRSLFSFCTKFGYIAFNIGAGFKVTKDNSKRAAAYIPPAVIFGKINSFKEKNFRNYLIVLLAYTLGLRVTELLNLKYGDFTVFKDNVSLYINGKGHKERNIAVPNEVYEEILNFKDELDNDKTYIFKGYKGNRLSYSHCDRLVKQVLGTDHHAHELRHNHSFHAIENGCNLNDLRKTLGHANLNTTQKYVDAMPTISSSNFIKFPTNKKAS